MAIAVLFVVATIGTGVIGIATTSSAVPDIAGVAVGECVTGGGVATRSGTVDCGVAAVTFRVAEHLSADDARCPGERYARLAQRGQGVLCLVPNLQVGKCYAPSDLGHSLADFAEVACSAPVHGGGAVAEVSDRADGTVIDCRDGVPITFTRPTPLSYCVEGRTR